MLDVLRKHASSWLIKVILGAIIISFAFFFGYNRMTRAKRSVQGLAPGQPVATVNGVEISDTEFRFFYDQNLERLKNTFKSESIPEGLQKFAQTMTLQQLIHRQLMIQVANSLGVRVTDAQLAETIRKNPELIKDGEFDPIFYRHQYLPYFENRFGINYEEFIRADLAINALESLFANVDAKPAQEEILWTFEVAAIKSKGDAPPFISSPKDWGTLAKKTGAEVKTVGPITIAERTRILEGGGALENYKKIFALNESHTVISEPIESGDKIYLVRLVEKKASPVKDVKPGQEREGDFLNNWMQQQIKTAKIVTYLE